MSQQDLLKIQTCILKVNIHCDGCEQKVKKLLQKIDGVYSVSIDAEQGKVLVSGHVDPAKLIKKLKASGKHAEIWGGQRGMAYNQNYPTNHQFKNLQVGNGKGGKDNKSQKQKGEKGGGGGGGAGQLAHFQNMKGAQDLKVPAKHQKSVKFNLPEEEFGASDDGSDEFDEYDEVEDDYDDDDYDDEEDEDEEGYPMHNKVMPMMGNGRGPHWPAGVMNGPAVNNNKGKGGGGGNYASAKKGDVIDLTMQTNGKGGNYNEVKNGNNGGKNSKVGKQKKGGGGGDSNSNNNKNKNNTKSGGEGGLLGRFLMFGKKSKKGGSADPNKNKNKNKNNNNKGEGGKKGGGKVEGHGNKNDTSKMGFDFHEYDVENGKGSSKGRNGKNVGPMGQAGSLGDNYPMDHQMRNFPAVQGLPAAAAMNGGGYFQGMQMQPTPYDLQQQQQQYLAMMLNQQHQQGNMSNMYQPPMMYGRPPHPSVNYMPPPSPPPPPPMPVSHIFSDENTESCSIM